MTISLTREQLLQALNATTSANDAKAAGDFLDGCSRTPGFAPELLGVIIDANIQESARQAAAIYLKNMISKYWEKSEVDDENDPKYLLSEEDKTFIRDHLIQAVTVAPQFARPQLSSAVQSIVRIDFPNRWPSFIVTVAQLLASSEASNWYGAYVVLYKFSKVYEYRRANERKPLIEAMATFLPILYRQFQQLFPNVAEEACHVQKSILKILYSLTQFSLNLDMLPLDALNNWLETCRLVILRPIPPHIAPITDREEAAMTQWWKCKKWAGKTLERLYERYCPPGQSEAAYKEFAKSFNDNLAIPCVKAFLTLLEQQRQGHIVTQRLIQLAISFISASVAHSATWLVLKPHLMDIITLVLFPLMRHSDEEEALWEEDMEEYIRVKYDIFEDLHNPTYAAGALLVSITKRKDTIMPILTFVINTLNTSKDPRDIDGGIYIIAELAQGLVKSKRFKKDVEKLLSAHVIPRLGAPERFVRSRAAYCCKCYSSAHFQNKDILKAMLRGLVALIVNDNEELPCKINAAIAIQYLLSDQPESFTNILRPYVSDIVSKILKLVAETHVEEVCIVMDRLVCEFVDEVRPIAIQLCVSLSDMFMATFENDDIVEERMPTLMTIITTLSSILEVIEDSHEIMVHAEPCVVKVINEVFARQIIDFYDDTFALMQSMLQCYISEPMWAIYPFVCEAFKAGNNVYLMYTDVFPIMHTYITVDPDAFLARPERLASALELSGLVLQDDEQGDDNQLFAAKLLELVVLQFPHAIGPQLPAIIILALQRLNKPIDGLGELRSMLILVLIAAAHASLEITVTTLKQLAPTHPNPLDFLTEQLLTLTTKWEGVHARKMAIIAWCLMFELAPEARPQVISYQPIKVLESCIKVFDGLEKAIKLQSELKELASSDSDEDSDEEEDVRTRRKTKRRDHRDIDEDLADSEDEVDESTTEYLESLAKQHKRTDDAPNVVSSDEDDDDGDFEVEYEETASEQYETPVDLDSSPDVFVLFGKTMEAFENREAPLFAQMISPLDADGQAALAKLIKTCKQHAKLEESKKVAESGGYSFGATEVPTDFNFSKA